MFSHPETGSDPPIGSDRESGCDSTPSSLPPFDFHHKFFMFLSFLFFFFFGYLIHIVLFGFVSVPKIFISFQFTLF